MTKACVSLNCHQRRQTCRVLRRKVEGVRAAAATHEGLQLCNFHEVSIEEVRQVPTRSPVKSSAIDLLPTFIQRELVDVTPTVRDTCAYGIISDCIRPSGQCPAYTFVKCTHQ